jgi:hypothetical protein
MYNDNYHGGAMPGPGNPQLGYHPSLGVTTYIDLGDMNYERDRLMSQNHMTQANQDFSGTASLNALIMMNSRNQGNSAAALAQMAASGSHPHFLEGYSRSYMSQNLPMKGNSPYDDPSNIYGVHNPHSYAGASVLSYPQQPSNASVLKKRPAPKAGEGTIVNQATFSQSKKRLATPVSKSAVVERSEPTAGTNIASRPGAAAANAPMQGMTAKERRR